MQAYLLLFTTLTPHRAILLFSAHVASESARIIRTESGLCCICVKVHTCNGGGSSNCVSVRTTMEGFILDDAQIMSPQVGTNTVLARVGTLVAGTCLATTGIEAC